jgi:hypothetical protein
MSGKIENVDLEEEPDLENPRSTTDRSNILECKKEPVNNHRELISPLLEVPKPVVQPVDRPTQLPFSGTVERN